MIFRGSGDWRFLYQPALIGLLIFAGMFFTYSAISRGIVSVAVPMLGLKVLFVVVLAHIIMGESFGPGYWAGGC